MLARCPDQRPQWQEDFDSRAEPVDVPLGHAAFQHEIRRPPRSLAAKTYTNIQRWTVMPRGGHFAAMEQPALLADDVAGVLPATAPGVLIFRGSAQPRYGGCGACRRILSMI
jgi:hypothetical protein